MYIEVLAAPPGEAPDWIQEAWVGLTLPTKGLWFGLVSGALSGPKQDWRNKNFSQKIVGIFAGQLKFAMGYAVNGADARKVLEQHRPDAASWWRANSPTVLSPDRTILFRAGCYRVVPEGRS